MTASDENGNRVRHGLPASRAAIRSSVVVACSSRVRTPRPLSVSTSTFGFVPGAKSNHSTAHAPCAGLQFSHTKSVVPLPFMSAIRRTVLPATNSGVPSTSSASENERFPRFTQ